MLKLSVALPVSSMRNGAKFLQENLSILARQTFKDFEVVVTDNSDDDELEKVCGEFKLDINYYRNPVKGMAQNTNEAIRRSQGEFIKILYMDDYLASENSLQTIVDKLLYTHWLVTGCLHDHIGRIYNPHYARFNDKIHLGYNTIGSPSVLTIANDQPLLFNEKLTWLLDCDYYKRCYTKYGEPTILNDLNVVIRQHPGQMTYLIPPSRKKEEEDYLKQKYETSPTNRS